MTIVSSREKYLAAGLEVLADLGYGGLKLAEICTRLGVTTGSFYHRFSSWKTYTAELGRYWVQTETAQPIDQLWAEPDPRRRLEQLNGLMLTIPHPTESAIRTWAAVDPEMRALLAEVDRRRFDTVATVINEVLHDERIARRYASWGIYLLVGYQDALIPFDMAALDWANGRILDLINQDAAGGTAQV